MKFKLTRLPDTPDGKVNFDLEEVNPVAYDLCHPLIDWDYDSLREEASKLKVGESTEFKLPGL